MKLLLPICLTVLGGAAAACQKPNTSASSASHVTAVAANAPVLMARYANFYRGDDDETATCRIYSDSTVRITFGGLDPAPAEQTFALTGDQDESFDNEMENFDNRPGPYKPDGFGEIPSDDAALPVMGAVIGDFASGLQTVDSKLDAGLYSLVQGICQIDGEQ